MDKQPIDFQKIINLDLQFIDQIEKYLQEKETQLTYQILTLFSFNLSKDSIPSLPLEGVQLKLGEAAEELSKKVRAFLKTKEELISLSDQKKEVKKLNYLLEEFIEILEGCAVELFQQVKKIPLDRWHLSIYPVVSEVKDILAHYVENLNWIIRRLESLLSQYFKKKEKTSANSWKSWPFFENKIIDQQLLKKLHQIEIYLKNGYKDFDQNYHVYRQMSLEIEKDLKQMENYPILALLDSSEQNLYTDLFRLLKMFELTTYSNKTLLEETAFSLKKLASAEHLTQFFSFYFTEVEQAFFNCSLEWKSLKAEESFFQEACERLIKKIEHYQLELQQLYYSISYYQNFLFTIEARVSFRLSWNLVRKQEKQKSLEEKNSIKLKSKVEKLIAYFSKLKDSLKIDPLIKRKQEQESRQVIDQILQEKAFSLASKNVIQKKFKSLLNQIKIYDEVGHPHLGSIAYIGEVLSQAMRKDWKYHVLHELPLFKELYSLHLGLTKFFDDPSHTHRLKHFLLLFNQIEEWEKKGTAYSHVCEVETDIHDIKTHLQDFLASIQRAARNQIADRLLDEETYKLSQQLMQYRYLFGNFIHSITKKDQHRQILRHDFLFIDQYFESAENLLSEINKKKKVKK